MTEGERLATLENQMDNIEKKVDDGFAAVMKRLDEQEKKFASKWVEDALRWFLYALIGAIVIAAMGFLIKGGLSL